MKRCCVALLLAAPVLAFTPAAQAQTCTPVSSYTNPLASLPGFADPPTDSIGLANSDPRLLQAPDGYEYVYYTLGNQIISFKSPDLVNWTENMTGSSPTVAFSKIRTGTKYYNLYVPGVFVATKSGVTTYYLFYIQNNTADPANVKSIGVATSSTAAGPFTDRTPTSLLVPGDTYSPTTGIADDAIDGSVFQDSNGNVYLTWKHRKHMMSSGASPVDFTVNDYVTQQQLDPNATIPYTAFVSGSSPAVLQKLFQNDITSPNTGVNYQSWEGNDNEHPLIFKGATGTYYLLYNGNDYLSANYAVGYATASSATGPYTRYASNPILAQTNGDGSAGGDIHGGDGSPNTILDNSPSPKRWILYRYKTDGVYGGSDRRTAIDELKRDGSGNLSVTATVTTQTSGSNITPCFIAP